MFATMSRPDAPLQRSLRAHAVLIWLVFLHFTAALAVSHHTGRPVDAGFIRALWLLFTIQFPAYLFVILMLRLRHMLTVVHPESPLAWILQDIRTAATDPDRMLGGAIAIGCFAIFQQSFYFLKIEVPVLVPFSWDIRFANWDEALHFGRAPWLWLLPLIGHPVVMFLLNMVYHAWFLLMFFFLFAAAFTRVNPVARSTFLIATILTWGIGGNLLATLLSSAGPVYFARLGFGNTFVPLMTMLDQMSHTVWLPALDVQEMLWNGYIGNGGLEGISAMPSMHVAASVLMTCYAFTWRRGAGWLMTVFSALIMIGSVALGWHYAIDGYAGALLALACWAAARRLAVWRT